MFTGIVETLGTVKELRKEEGNLQIVLSSSFTEELQIDQSVAHNGTCLTVVDIDGDQYTVTAIEETLQKTNLGRLQVGEKINLERCTQLNGRLDGHIVQGHVDTVGKCEEIEQFDGSRKFTFSYTGDFVTVEKGSITINGVSLTVVDSQKNQFSVFIIPFTFEHTSFKNISKGDQVNLEFDIIGKYVARLMNKE